MTIGLDDVVAAETSLSHVDGEAGRLIIAGHDLEELAGHVAFEDVTAMLWDGLVPNAAADPQALLGEARRRAYAHLAPLAWRLGKLRERANEVFRRGGKEAVAAMLDDVDVDPNR